MFYIWDKFLEEAREASLVHDITVAATGDAFNYLCKVQQPK